MSDRELACLLGGLYIGVMLWPLRLAYSRFARWMWDKHRIWLWWG